MKRNIKNQILQLRSEGKSYSEICKELNCNKASVSYHCGEGQKAKSLQRTKNRRSKVHPFKLKLERFIGRKQKESTNKNTLNKKNRKYITDKINDFFSRGKIMSNYPTVEQIIEHFSETPICYLTGKPININEPRTYHFDHKVPVSKGGTNTLDNLGICTKQANIAKNDMTQDELIEFCKTVLNHHGFQVTK